ncbi:MAG: hypothetical protein WBG36_07910 [Ornithinimicrobium sp.]
MSVLTELSQEFIDYPHDYLTITIVDVDPTVGDTINEDEDIRFRIQVANSGPMHVDELSLLVEGLSATEVKSNGTLASWGDSFVISGEWFGTVPAHQANNPVTSGGSPFHFRPTAAFGFARDLVRVSVEDWKTDWSHLQNSHTRKDEAAQGTYRSIVSPQ